MNSAAIVLLRYSLLFSTFLLLILLLSCHQDISEIRVQACKLVEIANADGTSTKYTYDRIGNLLTGDTPYSTYNYTYDAEFFVTSYTNINKSSGNKTTADYSYDNTKRISRIRYSDGTASEYIYTGNAVEIKYTSGSFSSSRRYDTTGRLIEYTTNDGTSYIIVNGRIHQTSAPDYSYRYIDLYDDKGRNTSFVYINYKDGNASETTYTFDNRPAPFQTDLRWKGFPVLLNIYGENSNNILTTRYRTYTGTNINTTPTYDNTTSYTYIYNSKGLPTERRNVSTGEITRYTYMDCD